MKGDICDLCKKSFHFKCAGTTKEKVQDAGVLICKVCKENCRKCSDYSEYKTGTKKEIKNLKSNISQLEKHVEHLNNELSSIHKQYDEKQKEYRRERKLRIKFIRICTTLPVSLVLNPVLHVALEVKVKMKSTGERTGKRGRDQGGLKITKIGSMKEEVITGKKSGN